MRIRFDKALVQDIPVILEMMEAFNAADHYPFDPAKARENLIEFICTPTLGRLFVIRGDELQAVGYMILTLGYSFEYGGKDSFIDEFFIKKDYKGMGIAQKALDFIEREARELGVHAIHLEVKNESEVKEPLFIKQGFQGTNRSLLTKVLA